MHWDINQKGFDPFWPLSLLAGLPTLRLDILNTNATLPHIGLLSMIQKSMIW